LSSLTLLLAGVMLVLFLLVVLLELSKPKKQKSQEPEIQVFFNKEIASEKNLPADYSTTEQLIALQAKYNGLTRKTEMAHSRLNDLEQEIVVSKNSSQNPKILKLEEKLDKLDNFRANTEVELQALKEVLASQIKAKQTGYESNFDRQKRLNDEYLQSIIFSNRKR